MYEVLSRQSVKQNSIFTDHGIAHYNSILPFTSCIHHATLNLSFVSMPILQDYVVFLSSIHSKINDRITDLLCVMSFGVKLKCQRATHTANEYCFI
jgi:hypothetical protein